MIKIGVFLGQFRAPESDNPECADCGTELEVGDGDKPINPQDVWYCSTCSMEHVTTQQDRLEAIEAFKRSIGV